MGYLTEGQILLKNKGTDYVQTSFQTCAKIQGISGIQDLQDVGSGILTDPGLAFCRRIQWIVDLVHAVFARSRGSWILSRKIAAGSWGCWILLRENSLAKVGLDH